jgi:polyisoprenoid-binding protein YceI
MSNATRRRYDIVEGRSAIFIEARSNVGPIAFGTTTLDAQVEVAVTDGTVDVDSADPSAHIELWFGALTSGNALYDAELLRRIDARRFPTTRVDLRSVGPIGTSGRYQIEGDLDFHGLTRRISGTVLVRVEDDGALHITGEHVFDIRDYDVAAPSLLMLRIYPDVRVELQLVVAAPPT